MRRGDSPYWERYQVIIDGFHGPEFKDGFECEAESPEHAAEQAGQDYNENGDVPLLNGLECIARVRHPMGGVSRWRVTAEPAIDYNAEE